MTRPGGVLGLDGVPPSGVLVTLGRRLSLWAVGSGCLGLVAGPGSVGVACHPVNPRTQPVAWPEGVGKPSPAHPVPLSSDQIHPASVRVPRRPGLSQEDGGGDQAAGAVQGDVAPGIDQCLLGPPVPLTDTRSARPAPCR